MATNGDFCSRHTSKPVRWNSNHAPPSPILRGQLGPIRILQRFWRQRVAPRLRRYHGPSTFCIAASANTTDIFSLEPLTTIPFFYRISYLDEQRLCWTFDLRFLVQTMLDDTGSDGIKNPFTQSAFTPSMLARIQGLLAWMKQRGYPSVYVNHDVLTTKQRWDQKVLEVFLRYHTLGYALQPGWFEALGEEKHRHFYRSMWMRWNDLSARLKWELIPEWDSVTSPLFRWRPERLSHQTPSLKWWKKTTLALFERFVSKGVDGAAGAGAGAGAHRGTGALIILSAFAQAHPPVAEAFPFLGA